MKVTSLRHRIAVDSRDASARGKIWKETFKFFFDSLRAEAENCDCFRASRAAVRDFLFCVTMMATRKFQRLSIPNIVMHNHARFAVRTLHHPSTILIRARDPICISAPIQEDDRLPAGSKPLTQRNLQSWTNKMHSAIAPKHCFLAEIDNFHARGCQSWRSIWQLMQLRNSTLLGVEPTFQTRRRATQDDWACRQLRSTNRNISSVISRRLILFV